MNRRSLLRSMLALPFLGLRGKAIADGPERRYWDNARMVQDIFEGCTFKDNTFVVGDDPIQYRFTMGIHPVHGFSPSAYKFFQLKDLPPCTAETLPATGP